MVIEELGLDGEGAQGPSQHNDVQPSLIGGRVDDIGEDVIVMGTVTEHEEQELRPPLVVG
jgi:hypothetical protein